MTFHPDAANPNIAVESWWENSANPMYHTPTPLQSDKRCDVAIIGGGYTGLNAAKHLAENGIHTCVCEAGHIGWGAPGRNGGFCGGLSTKQSFSTIVSKYGIDAARKAVGVQIEAIEQVREFYSNAGLEKHTPHESAELAVAHTPHQLREMHTNSQEMERVLGLRTTVMSKEELNEIGAKSPAFYGGMIEPWGFGIHP